MKFFNFNYAIYLYQSLLKIQEKIMIKKRHSVIICGRQHISAYENILNIINFLEADVFLVYENDSCNYSKLAIASLKVENDKKLLPTENQFKKIKKGWNLMEKYEKKHNFEYFAVYRLRPDIIYAFHENNYHDLLIGNAYLNSDFVFYGLRKEIFNCFNLLENWNYLVKEKQQYFYEVNDLFETILVNTDNCFDSGKWKFVNKLLAIPIASNNNKIVFNKNTFLHFCKKYKNKKISEILTNSNYSLYFWNNYDKLNKFPCELSILLVLLNRKIIPNHSNFIEVLRKC